jgi:HAD superfamily hydrolase (TIGR01509 family)
LFDALVFDFDGTILDTELPHYTTWQAVFQRHGCELPIDMWTAAVGGSGDGFDPLSYLEAQAGCAVDREAIRTERRRGYLELVEAQGILPGVAEYIEAARRLSLRLAIASSSPRSWVAGHLQRLRLRGYFEAIRCADDVARVKPDPELYRTAAACLGVEAAAAIAIEDSHNGMLSAAGAGLACVIVPNEVTRGQNFQGAHLRLDSLADLPLDELLRRLAQGRTADAAAAG